MVNFLWFFKTWGGGGICPGRVYIEFFFTTFNLSAAPDLLSLLIVTTVSVAYRGIQPFWDCF